jgi:hypothetical protein
MEVSKFQKVKNNTNIASGLWLPSVLLGITGEGLTLAVLAWCTLAPNTPGSGCLELLLPFGLSPLVSIISVLSGWQRVVTMTTFQLLFLFPSPLWLFYLVGPLINVALISAGTLAVVVAIRFAKSKSFSLAHGLRAWRTDSADSDKSSD